MKLIDQPSLPPEKFFWYAHAFDPFYLPFLLFTSIFLPSLTVYQASFALCSLGQAQSILINRDCPSKKGYCSFTISWHNDTVTFALNPI